MVCTRKFGFGRIRFLAVSYDPICFAPKKRIFSKRNLEKRCVLGTTECGLKHPRREERGEGGRARADFSTVVADRGRRSRGPHLANGFHGQAQIALSIYVYRANRDKREP